MCTVGLYGVVPDVSVYCNIVYCNSMWGLHYLMLFTIIKIKCYILCLFYISVLYLYLLRVFLFMTYTVTHIPKHTSIHD